MKTSNVNSVRGAKRRAAKEQRRKEAEARNAVYNKLTVVQKIAMLDKYGWAAIKQRAKLQKQLQDEQKEQEKQSPKRKNDKTVK